MTDGIDDQDRPQLRNLLDGFKQIDKRPCLRLDKIDFLVGKSRRHKVRSRLGVDECHRRAGRKDCPLYQLLVQPNSD